MKSYFPLQSQWAFALTVVWLWQNVSMSWAVVVAQLVEQSLLTPEVRGWIRSLAKFILNMVFCQLCWKTKIKKREAGNGPFLLKNYHEWSLHLDLCRLQEHDVVQLWLDVVLVPLFSGFKDLKTIFSSVFPLKNKLLSSVTRCWNKKEPKCYHN